MFESASRLSMAVMMIILAVLMTMLAACAESRTIPTNNLQGDCPSSCKCILTDIHCKDLLSLPGHIPNGMQSLTCTGCHIRKITGHGLQNYTGLGYVSLQGNSILDFKDGALEAFKDIGEVILSDFQLASRDVRNLRALGNILLSNISELSPETVITSTSTVPTSEVEHTSRGAKKKDEATTEDGLVIRTTPEISSSRSVESSSHARSTHTMPADYKTHVPSTSLPNDLTQYNEELLIAICVMVACLLFLALARAVCRCNLRKQVQNSDHSYTQVDPPENISRRLKRYLGMVTPTISVERSPNEFQNVRVSFQTEHGSDDDNTGSVDDNAGSMRRESSDSHK